MAEDKNIESPVEVEDIDPPEIESEDPPVELLEAETEDTGQFNFKLPDLKSLTKTKPVQKKAEVPSVDLGDDPVRLYLREIGRVDLLNPDQEFWLATRLHATRTINSIRQSHPALKNEPNSPTEIYKIVIDKLVTSWRRLQEDSEKLGHQSPDLRLILAESRVLRQIWDAGKPSQLRRYLAEGAWGQDPHWDEVARQAIEVFSVLYLLPDNLANYLDNALTKRGKLPSKATLLKRLTDDALLEREILFSHENAQEAHEALIRANLRLVVSVAKRYMGRGNSFDDLDPGGEYWAAQGCYKIRPCPRF